MVEGTGLENRHTVYAVSRVRISPCPLNQKTPARGSLQSLSRRRFRALRYCFVKTKMKPDWLRVSVLPAITPA